MIVFETRLGELIELLPPYVNTVTETVFPIKYGWGTQDELNKYLSLPRAESPYPLVWLNVGIDKDNLNEPRVQRRARILIATNSDKQSEMNPFVYQTDYKEILVPVAQNLIKALQQSGISQIINNEIDREFLPNFSIRENNGQVDVWNVLMIEAEIAFIGQECINRIYFN